MSKLGILKVRAEQIVREEAQHNSHKKELKIVKKQDTVVKETPKKVEPKPKNDGKSKTRYSPLVESRELPIANGIKLVFNVNKTKKGDPHIDIRTYITSEKYTGFTDKGIHFNIENLEEFRQIIGMIDEELAEKGL